jgi:hypothetical protein
MDGPDLVHVTPQLAVRCDQLDLDKPHSASRARFVAMAQQREDALHAALGRAGVDALELATDDDLADAVLRFADMRRQRTRLAGGGLTPMTPKASEERNELRVA